MASGPVLGIPLTCETERAADAGEDDDVVFGAEIAVAEFLVGEVGVGDFVVVERGAHPAFILRALPGVDVADARDGQGMGLHLWRGGCEGGEAEVLNRGADLWRRFALRMMKAPARRLMAIDIEVVFGGLHFDVGVFEAEGA